MLPLGIVAASLGYGVFYWAAKLWGGHPVSWADVFGLGSSPASTRPPGPGSKPAPGSKAAAGAAGGK